MEEMKKVPLPPSGTPFLTQTPLSIPSMILHGVVVDIFIPQVAQFRKEAFSPLIGLVLLPGDQDPAPPPRRYERSPPPPP